LVRDGILVNDINAEVPNAFIMRSIISSRLSYYKDETKTQIRKVIGDSIPAWFDKAGKKGIFKMAEEFKDNGEVVQAVENFRSKDAYLGDICSRLIEKSAGRLAYGYEQVAHDICKFLEARNCKAVAIESRFMAKVAALDSPAEIGDEYALSNSQKYRHFVGVAKFVDVIKRIATKYGIVVRAIPPVNTTRMCQYCNHVNLATGKQQFQCRFCYRLIDQDYNAAFNLSRFVNDLKLATTGIAKD